MIMNILVIAMVGLIAYLWASQGFFSALMHLACVVVAGAVAFALWEPLTYGFLINLNLPFQELAFTLGLMAPFLVTLAVLRIACDKLIPRGLDFDEATNFVGGLVCGAGSGLITAGILVTAISFLRLPPGFLGHRPVDYDAAGNIVKSRALWLPADELTVGLYEYVSRGSLATATPLATRAPDAHLRANMVRFTFDGKGRTSANPKDFSIVGRYTVAGEGAGDFTTDSFSLTPDGDPVRQDIKLLDGTSVSGPARIEGFVLRLGPGAKEKSGKFVTSRGQVQLITRTPEGEARILQPVAVISQADATRLDLGRWRFDAPSVQISSVGGASETAMAFEFVVPQGWETTDLLFRNVRMEISPQGGGTEFASTSERDEAVTSRSMFTDLNIADPVLAAATEARQPTQNDQPITDPVRVTDRIGPNWSVNTTNRGGLQVQNIDRNNYIIDGSHTFTREQMNERGLDQNLRLERFAETADTKIVQVDVSRRSPLSVLGKAADAALSVAPPQLVDSLGQVYDAIGFVYDDGRNVQIRFTPGQPIRALRELPTLSNSRENERLTLIFRASAGVEIVRFNIGNQTQQEFSPPIKLPSPRR